MRSMNVRAERYVEQDVSAGYLERGKGTDGAWDVSRYLGEVERQLTAALAHAPDSLAHDSETLATATKHLTLGTGGKRVRPMLAHLFGKVCGAREDEVVSVGVSSELVHTASLLHDDVIDQGMYRRGRPTVNALWGNIVAVMAGDMLLTVAIQQLEGLDRRVTSEAVRTVAEMTKATIAEVEGRGDLGLAVERFRAICEGKTGALFGYCGSAVGILVGDTEASERLSRFARHLGVAFQFADDVLDLTGRDPGKPQFADLRSRTPSLPMLLAVSQSDAIRRQIRDLWAFGSMPDAKVREVGEAILASGVAEEAAARVRAEIASAEEALGPYALRPGGEELTAWSQELARSVSMSGNT